MILKRKTDNDFKKEVFDLVGDEYTFLDTYQGARTKIKVRHNKCGHVYKVTPSHFIEGSCCPYCKGGIKKTNKQFKKEVFNLVVNEYEFLDSYINAYTKIKVKHNKCGSIYKVTPSAFLRGTRCPYCAGNVKKTDIQFKQKVFDLVGDEYTFLDPYVNAKTKLRVKHAQCGNIYKVAPRSFFDGSRCPYCSGYMKKTNAQFKQEVQNLVGGEYEFLDPYINAYTKIRVKHNKCNTVYEVRPYSFLEGYRCPYCNSPKGETIITKILNSLNIQFEYQKTFPNLKDAQPLSYDFFIPNQSILIEYQGIQHYQPVAHFGGNAKFKIQQEHDKLKSDYAKNNGYNLINVPYTEDNFSKIKKYLIKHGLTR